MGRELTVRRECITPMKTPIYKASEAFSRPYLISR